MRLSQILLTVITFIPGINAGVKVIDLSGVNFQVQDGDLAFDVFLPAPENCQAFTNGTCTAFATLLEGKGLEDPIDIPCGECVTMGGYTNGETVETGLINVIGLLDFPEGTKVKLVTPGVVVQGRLSMHQSQPIDGEPEISIELKGTEDVVWNPELWNGEACIDYSSGVENCRLGKRAVVAAGGVFDIHGFPKPECPTWVKLADTIPRPPMAAIDYPEPTPPKTGCTGEILQVDFTNGLGDWKSSLGASVSLSSENSPDGNPYATVTDRARLWQGLSLDATGDDWLQCLEVNTTYLFQMTIRLDSNNNGPSVCSSVGQNCPSFRSHYLYDNTQLKWKTFFQVPGSAAVVDGTWATYTTEFKFTEEEFSLLNTYNTFYIAGVEEGVDISVSSVSIILPDAKYFPAPPQDPSDPWDSMCNEMVVNGDAEASNIYAHPHYLKAGLSGYLAVEQEVVTDDSGNTVTNNYFSVKGREKQWNSIETVLLTDCIEQYAVYRFRAKVRVHSAEPKRLRITIKTKMNVTDETPDGPPVVESVGYCPESSISIGWVECDRNFMFTDKHVGAEFIQLLIVAEDDEFSVVDYDDISVGIKYTPVNEIIINNVDVDGCWAPGAEAIITSHTILPEDTRVITIDTIETNFTAGTSKISFADPIPAHTTLKDDPVYAVEVALLSRNILIKPQDDVEIMNVRDGGHMMILHTPNLAQYIEGIELRGMGQQGILGRYPLHFHLSEHVPGSLVSKNTVRDSHQRCYVLHGTHNVTLSENIAYNTSGHCYMVEDGFEQNNTFAYNLGALTHTMDIHSLLSISESDHFASTFWISNPNNHFIGNVCAGGEDTGFWYEFLTLVRGPSAEFDPYYEVNPSEFTFGSFVGNIIHSYKGDGFKLYPNGYFPKEHANFTDMISFRNAGDGVLLHNSAKLHIKGGIFADNRVQVEIDKQADDVWVTDATVIGYSYHFRKEVEASNTKSHCPASRPNVGIQLHSYLRYRNSQGYWLKNITFEQFGEDLTGCIGSVGIDLDPESRDGHFDAYSYFEDLHFPPGTASATKISLCKNEEVSGLKDVIFEDWTGDLNPDETATGQGAVVSRNGTMDAFIDGCVEMEGSCALYCPGGCYRGINFATSQAVEYLDWKIEAILNTDPTKRMGFEGYFDNQTRLDFDDCEVNMVGEKFNCKLKEDHYNNYIFQRRRYFTATLPKGDYTLQFVDGQGNVGWPVFIEMQWEDNSTCPEAINDETITLNIPTPSEQECEQIIKNNGGEENFVNHWMHAGGDVQIVSPGYNSNHAIASVTRTGAWQGPGQYVDTRCFEVGDYYEVTARVRLESEANPGTFINCNPYQKHYMHPEVCPRISFRMREILGNEIGDEVITTFVSPVAETVGPYNANEWNYMYGLIKITEHIANQDTIFMFVERTTPGVRIIVDDITMGKVIKGESDESYNRGFEKGDTRFWSTIGDLQLDIVSPGYSGSEYALKAYNRDKFWSSPEQELNQETMVLGHSYSVKAKIKLEINGQPQDCVPGWWWGLEGSELSICPSLTLRQAIHNSSFSNWTDIGVTVGAWESGGWNDVYGVFEVTQEMLDAPAVTVVFSKLHESIDLIIDDVSISEVNPPGCDDLITNNGGEMDGGNPYYWKIYGHGSVDVRAGGMDSAWALHNFDRPSPTDGIRQIIDPECVHKGAVYEVIAWVKMIDTSGNPVDCVIEQTYGDSVNVVYDTKKCPWVNIGAQNPGGAPQHRAVAFAIETWKPDQWNLLKGHFKFFPNEVVADSIFLSITQVPLGVELLVDNVSVQIMKMPTSMPSVSFAPTITTAPSDVPSMSSESPSTAPSVLASNAPSQVTVADAA